MARKLPRYGPGKMLRAADWNQVVGEVERLGQITALPPLEVKSNNSGVQLRWQDNLGLWAKLTSQDGTTGACAWTEQVCKADGKFEDKTNARVGTTTASPAFEVNGARVTIPSYAWIRPAWEHPPGDGDPDGITGLEYDFEVGGQITTVLAQITARTYPVVVGGLPFTVYTCQPVDDSDSPSPLTYTNVGGTVTAYSLNDVDLPLGLIVRLWTGGGAYYVIGNLTRVDLVRKTSDTPLDGTTDQYPGQVLRWRDDSQTFEPWTTCIIVDANAP